MPIENVRLSRRDADRHDGAPPHSLLQRISLDRLAGHDLQTRQSRRKSWRRLDGHNQLPKVILGVEFADGIEAQGRGEIGPTRVVPKNHIRA